jgi:peptide chain release factor 3
MAGTVKARGERRRARSDWMKVEQRRGISVSASVMTYEYQDCIFNLLDTPGHEDFSEDTYRTLTAVDSAVMVLDAAKGIETQTRKLFEVCRLRDMPIITFINKLDREGLEPLELLDEVEQTLQLEVCPASWPIGMGDRFRGCYDLFGDRLLLLEASKEKKQNAAAVCEGVDDPRLDEWLGEAVAAQLREDVNMARELCPPFDLDSYREGNLTPVYFGSALYNFGVPELLDGLVRFAPPPRPQAARKGDEVRMVAPDEEKVTAFVFKIQANMDPKHRDRIAFTRVCSGHFRRGMKLKHVRQNKQINVHNPVMFMARDRELAESAYPGDIIGIPNRGALVIGDSLTEGEMLRFSGIPSFAPEVLRTVRAEDAMRNKHLERALRQIAEEGAARVFKRLLGGGWVVGVVGPLQFEVLAERIKTEYDIAVIFESTTLLTARWIESDDPRAIRRFNDAHTEAAAEDHTGTPVFLARNNWHLEQIPKDFPELRFLEIKEQM